MFILLLKTKHTVETMLFFNGQRTLMNVFLQMNASE